MMVFHVLNVWASVLAVERLYHGFEFVSVYAVFGAASPL